VENGHALELCTMGGVIFHDNQWWGVTAGHALNGFGNGQRVWYFPEAIRSLLGAYSAPAFEQPDMDLAKIQVSEDLISINPIGFGQAPSLFAEDQVTSLVQKRVVFLGAQIGRTSGTITAVKAVDQHSRAIIVRLACVETQLGDSGGPLYYEEGTQLWWVGTLVSGRSLPNQPGFSEGLFLHPGRALAALGIA